MSAAVTVADGFEQLSLLDPGPWLLNDLSARQRRSAAYVRLTWVANGVRHAQDARRAARTDEERAAANVALIEARGAVDDCRIALGLAAEDGRVLDRQGYLSPEYVCGKAAGPRENRYVCRWYADHPGACRR